MSGAEVKTFLYLQQDIKIDSPHKIEFNLSASGFFKKVNDLKKKLEAKELEPTAVFNEIVEYEEHHSLPQVTVCNPKLDGAKSMDMGAHLEAIYKEVESLDLKPDTSNDCDVITRRNTVNLFHGAINDKIQPVKDALILANH